MSIEALDDAPVRVMGAACDVILRVSVRLDRRVRSALVVVVSEEAIDSAACVRPRAAPLDARESLWHARVLCGVATHDIGKLLCVT